MSLRRAFALCALLAALAPHRAHACASVVRGPAVRIVGEEALIVWDPVHHIEHFIRRGDFETAAPSFGFLVPTPAVPTLSEADEAAFARLTRAIEPETQRVRRWTLGLPLCLGMMFVRGAVVESTGRSAPVRVLLQTRVAGLDAAVLEASDAPALAEWLRAHDYPSRPALEAWLAPYVARHWNLTAFKVAKGAPEGGIGMKAVRLTFAADAPFYPYREPDDAPDTPGRSLRVTLVTPGLFEGQLGDEHAPWPATLEYARPMRHADTILAGALPASLIPQGAWLSSFLDLAARRPRADLFFVRAEEQHEVVPPPNVREDEVEIPFPAEPLFLGLGLWLWLRRRRRRTHAQGG